MYTTDALVVGSDDRLTADRMFALFTRDAGLVYARAAGVRKEASKLRYGLQDFSLVRVSLVRGKQGWRVVGAERARNLYFEAIDRHARAALLRTLRLVRRLVRGEEAHTALYDTLIDGLAALAVCGEAELERGERMLTLRLLCALGYIAPKSEYEHVLAALTLQEILVSKEDEQSKERTVQRAIDEALAISQL
mgnify:CR=1 FL=1